MAWRLFNWGSRGPFYDAGRGVYVATRLIPQCCQVTIFGHDVRLDELLHSFHVRAAHTPVTISDCEDIANRVATWADTVGGLKSIIHEGIVVDRVVATAIDVVDGPQFEVPSNVVGLLPTPGLPSEVTLSVKKNGFRRGRQYRGRFYAWPANTAALDPADSNLFTAAFASAVQDAYEALLVSLNGNGTPLCVASLTYGALYDVQTITVVDRIIDHQDRRAAGRGR